VELAGDHLDVVTPVIETPTHDQDRILLDERAVLVDGLREGHHFHRALQVLDLEEDHRIALLRPAAGDAPDQAADGDIGAVGGIQQSRNAEAPAAFKEPDTPSNGWSETYSPSISFSKPSLTRWPHSSSSTS
jgi:hypothetical protein